MPFKRASDWLSRITCVLVALMMTTVCGGPARIKNELDVVRITSLAVLKCIRVITGRIIYL